MQPIRQEWCLLREYEFRFASPCADSVRLAASKEHRPLHPTLPITTLLYPVAHGCTSKGVYESSAVFVRYDPGALKEQPQALKTAKDHEEGRSEFLFFGDVESAWRAKGEEDVGETTRAKASKLNKEIWEEAARSIREGRLAGIFVRQETGTPG